MDSEAPESSVVTERTVKGFKVLEFKKPPEEKFEGPVEAADLLKEVYHEAEDIEFVLICYLDKQKTFHWVGNVGDNAGAHTFLTMVQEAVIGCSVEDLFDAVDGNDTPPAA